MVTVPERNGMFSPIRIAESHGEESHDAHQASERKHFGLGRFSYLHFWKV